MSTRATIIFSWVGCTGPRPEEHANNEDASDMFLNSQAVRSRLCSTLCNRAIARDFHLVWTAIKGEVGSHLQEELLDVLN